MKKIKIALAFSFLFLNAVNAQGPWVNGKNKAFVQIGFSGIFYNQVKYDGNTIDANTDFSDLTTQLYAEYGICNKMDIIAILPYKSLSYKDNTTATSQSLSGLGNVTIGFKYLIYDKKWKVSSGIFFSGNSTQYDDLKGLRTGFQSNFILPYISVGSSKNNWYYFGNLGYGYMSSNFSDYLKVTTEVGYKFFKTTHLIVNLDLKSPLTKEKFYTTDNLSYAISGNYLDRQQYLAVGLKLNHEFVKDKYGINLGAIGAFDLDNAPLAPSINLGVYTKF